MSAIAPETRRLTPRVLAWEPRIGQPLPLPVVEDDRSQMSAGAVKSVLAWLNAIAPQWAHAQATPITISLYREDPGSKPWSEEMASRLREAARVLMGRPPASLEDVAENIRAKHGIPAPRGRAIQASVDYCHSAAGIRAETLEFRPCTVELLLRSRKMLRMVCSYEYLAARDQQNRVIVGTLLRSTPRETA